ncbi:MAG: ATP-grasp domain-containing protein [Lachnospiraceae bacterium]|nr:ATP-grasp domain-containing protein [Lachnospiraceae bacterium]
MFNAWLIYDKEGAKKNKDYIAHHKEVGEKMGIHFELKMREEIFSKLPAPKPDFAIVRTICPELSKKLEAAKIPAFNTAFVSEICNDKGKTIDYIQKKTKVPVIPTERFKREKLSKDLLIRYPDSVIKTVDGHGGKQVFLTSEKFSVICAGIGSSDFVIQPFVRGVGKDVRVYVVGQTIVGAVERTATEGFRSNFSLGGTVKNYLLSEEEKALIEEICSVFSFGLVGIDFIINEKGKFVFNEIEDVVGARMLYQCQPEISLLEQYFSFILDKMLQNN